MPTANLGRVQPIYKGVYNAVTDYAPLDLVKYSGTVYWCIGAVVGVAPPAALYWVALTAQELTDYGITATAAELNILDGVTATAAELNILDGVTATAAQLNYASQVSGRNYAYNPTGAVNQRVYVSGTATTAANQFTLDRWFVIVSGQSLSFTGVGGARVMTAPAGGVAQVIEGLNIAGGTYVCNWDGTATCKVNGTTYTKGEAFTLLSSLNATIAFYGGTFTNVKVERGALSPFSYDDFALELHRCKRYYEKTFSYAVAPASSTGVDGAVAITSVEAIGNANHTNWRFSAEKRGAPVITTFNPLAAGSGWRDVNNNLDVGAVVDAAGTSGATLVIAGAPQAHRRHYIHASADAEITS